MKTALLLKEIAAFRVFGEATSCEKMQFLDLSLPVFVNEFWTSKQRAGHPLHEISYRACFKPQLPRFFIDRLTQVGDVVYDPFMGRGTTLLEAALLGRKVIGCDINPLSERLVRPRIEIPDLEAIRTRLEGIELNGSGDMPEDLLTFYHPKTLRQILALRAYLLERESSGQIDSVDRWIRMVATNRLTGHSPGFFSVYTMPPNQAVSVASQKRINTRRNQAPPRRELKEIVLKKTRSLQRKISGTDRVQLQKAAASARYFTCSCDSTPEIETSSVDLVVTSPPFLDVIDYRSDNWLRGWFNHFDSEAVPIWQLKKPEDWVAVMRPVFRELARVLKRGGRIAFEVGEVRNAKLKMETLVLRAATEVGLVPEFVLINRQKFTKTSNCWGVTNGTRGTNTNRVVVFHQP